jgi:hypothetical protein
VLVIVPMFVGAVASVLADLGMLADAYGAFRVLIFASPTLAMLVWSRFR